MVEGDQQQRFEQLALDGRALDGDDGFLREDGHAFLDGPDVAVQPEVGQVGKEALVKDFGRAQVVDILLREAQVVDGVDELLQPRHDGVAAAVRHAAEEHVKDGDLVLIPFVQVAGRHRQFVEVGHRRQVAFYIQHWWSPLPAGGLVYLLSPSRLQAPRMDKTQIKAYTATTAIVSMMTTLK